MPDDHARAAFQPHLADDHDGLRFNFVLAPELDALLRVRAAELQCQRSAVVRMILTGNLAPLAHGHLPRVQRG